MALPAHVLGGAGETSPNNKLNIAGVGVGGQGGHDVDQFRSENIVALCDVDSAHAAHTFKQYPNAKRYKDFREMLDKEKSIDAVVVATPDHMHAIVSMTAIKHGKHVYCEKPLTRTVYEARAVAKAAREAKVATQMGNQGMAFEGNRLINEWLWAGAIGPVREVHVWSDRPTHRGKMPLWWPQGIERPKETPPVPDTLDWDLWLGPAPVGPIIRPTSRSAGAVGGISARAAWGTWAFTTWPRVLSAQTGRARHSPGKLDACVRGDRPVGGDGALPVPRARRSAAGAAALVRRRAAAGAPRGTGGEPQSWMPKTASSLWATKARCS